MSLVPNSHKGNRRLGSRMRTLALAPLLLLLALPAAGLDAKAVLVQERAGAYQVICAGKLSDGAAALVASVKAVPPDLAECADEAYSSLQLLVFVMDYLMDEATLARFRETCLNETGDDTDRFIGATYDIQKKREKSGKREAAINLHYGTACRNKVIQAAALFMLSNPHIFNNDRLLMENRELLVLRFPDLALTRTAIRLPIYKLRKAPVADIAKRLDELVVRAKTPEKSRIERDALVVRMATDDVCLSALRGVLPFLILPTTEPVGVVILCQTIAGHVDWEVRYGGLLMAGKYSESGYRREVMKASALAGAVASKTPDAVLARMRVSRLASKELRDHGDMEEQAEGQLVWAVDALLNSEWSEGVYERNLYEDVMRSAFSAAECLDETGRTQAALTAYERLAAKYPNSLVSERCQKAIEALNGLPSNVKEALKAHLDYWAKAPMLEREREEKKFVKRYGAALLPEIDTGYADEGTRVRLNEIMQCLAQDGPHSADRGAAILALLRYRFKGPHCPGDYDDWHNRVRSADFPEEARRMLRERLDSQIASKGTPSTGLMTLIGASGDTSQVPKLREFIPVFDPRLVPASVAGRSSPYLLQSYPPLLACARLGDKQSIKECIELMETVSNYQVSQNLETLSYVRQPEVVEYIWQFLFSDEKEPDGGTDAPGMTYQGSATYALLRMLPDFPYMAKLEERRKWMSEQRWWHILR